MISTEELKKIDNHLFNVSMLVNTMLMALKNYESECGECTEIIYLGELIQKKIKNILEENDKILT